MILRKYLTVDEFAEFERQMKRLYVRPTFAMEKSIELHRKLLHERSAVQAGEAEGEKS